MPNSFDLPALIVATFIFFLPAYLANMMPVIAMKLPLLKHYGWWPLDGGKKLFGKRILGDHKTFMGSLSGVFLGFLLSLPFVYLAAFLQSRTVVAGEFLAVFLLCVGAILGDMIKSFFKRMLGIKSGAPWFFFDQNDFVIGAWSMQAIFFGVSMQSLMILLCALLITPLLHFLTNVTAYKLKLKDVWW